MTVGFGAKQIIGNSRLLPMIFASFGIAFSVFLGMVAGHANFTLIPIVIAWGFGYGMLTRREAGYGWVAQQCVTTLLVGSAFPFSPRAAAVRACLMLAGGAIQVLSSSLLLRIFSELRRDLNSLVGYVIAEQLALRDALSEAVSDLRQHRFADSVMPYAIRLAITLGVSTEIYRRMHFASGYWIPMTALLVLKPGFADTVRRAIARTVGTMAGAWLISMFVAHFTPSPVTLAVFTVVFAWLSYATLNVNYALFAMFLTGYIVFLLSLTKLPEMDIAHRRVMCTAIGGGLALTVRLIVIFRTRKRVQQVLSSPTEEVALPSH
ncbi:FUSC family protein [Silvibacterium acidisoli]|uniref:FUSC family protein n=1 Tax=Acidobacteriaceae bacterium ZG23-2 TaxID=2883246 RepID=UPI00406D2A90